MKKNIIKNLIIIGLLACGVFLSSCAKKKAEVNDGTRKIVVATGGNTAPSTYRNEKDELVGYETEVVKEVFSRLPQYTYEFTIAEAHSTLTGLDAGLYQVSYNTWGYNKARGEKYIVSDVNAVIPHAILLRDDNTDIKTVFDLPGHKVITIPGNANDNIYRAWNEKHPNNQIEVGYVETIGDFSLQVLNKEIDFYYHSKPVINAQLEKTGIQGLKVIDVSVDDNYTFKGGLAGNFFYFPKGEEKLRDDFNQAFEAAVADGAIEKIFQKYYPGYEFLVTPEYIKESREFIEKDLAN